MRNLLPIDSLNAFEGLLELSPQKKTQETIDEVYDLLILAYTEGVKAVSEVFGIDIEPDLSQMDEAINKEYDGQTYADRIEHYADLGDIAGINLVADTNMHRVYNQAVLDAADSTGEPYTKTWITMDDEKVRSSHQYLEGMQVFAGEDFYTYTGAHAPFPGYFGTPQEDCNCRCTIDITPL